MSIPSASQLAAQGLSGAEASRKALLFQQAVAALRNLDHDDADAIGVWVPGRIELLGKHTDYAGGRSLLCAAERGICLVASRGDDARVRVRDARLAETIECPSDAAPLPAGWHATHDVCLRADGSDHPA